MKILTKKAVYNNSKIVFHCLKANGLRLWKGANLNSILCTHISAYYRNLKNVF